MNNKDIEELMEQYTITGSQSESLDIPFSPGSQDSISNVQLDFAWELLNCNNPEIKEPIQQFLEGKGYNLKVSFESQTLPVTKSAAWTYSESLNRLYVNIGQPCPIRLGLKPVALRGASLRCLLRYQKPEYANDAVTQCANHSHLENNLPLRGHVLRCKKAGVRYEETEGRCSLCLPFDRDEADDVDGDTYVFEFKCLSTCLGRRTMELVFQVEYSGNVVCSHSVNVRVCSCPGRDRRHDENPSKNPHLKSKMKFEQGAGPSKRHFDDEEFTIKVKGRRNYELMLALKQRLEMADVYESQVAEGKQDAELASPRPKMLVMAKEQLKDQAKALSESSSSDVDRSHHRWRVHLHPQQLQQSQNLLTGKIRKNKALPGAVFKGEHISLSDCSKN